MAKRSFYSGRNLQLAFILTTGVLVAVGLLFVFESSVAEAFSTFGNQYYFLKQQSIRLLIGLVALLAAVVTPIKVFRALSPLIFFGSLFLLLAVFIPGLSTEINGAYRWLILGPIRFQPVELTKLGMVLFFAHWLSEHQRMRPLLFLTGIPVAILLLQPDMGSLLILVTIAGGMFFAAGGSPVKLGLISIPVVAALSLAVLTSSYRIKRLQTFLNPESDPLGASFHIRQITLALANGGWFGQGVGNSKQKYLYIPEASTDSIFAIIAEELGFIGSVVIIAGLGFYLLLCNRVISLYKPGSYESLVATGIMIWIGIQTILNLGAVVALVPLTGLPLPFFSYGGSSLIMVLLATGIMIQLARKP